MRRVRAPSGAPRSLLGGFHDFYPIANLVEPPVSLLGPGEHTIRIREDASRRSDLREMASGVDWPLGRLALEWLPRWYVEEFASRAASVVVRSPESLTIHAAFLPFVQDRFVAARLLAEGAHLHIYQHAGAYGEIRGFLLHHAESLLADQFKTWGWKLRGNDVPFVALRLMRRRYQRIRARPGIGLWLYVLVRQTFPWDLDRTIEVQDRFFGELREDLSKAAVIRPRADGGASWTVQVCERASASVHGIDDGTSEFVAVANCVGLVVLDGFPSTAFIECLKAGLPVIAIVAEAIPFTELAQPFYDEFFKLGLLHETPESAAQFLNRLSVREWWESVRSSDCVRDYLSLFCRTEMPR